MNGPRIAARLLTPRVRIALSLARFVRAWTKASFTTDANYDPPFMVLGPLNVPSGCRIGLRKRVFLLPGLHLEVRRDIWINIDDKAAISCVVRTGTYAELAIGIASHSSDKASRCDIRQQGCDKLSIGDLSYTAGTIPTGENVGMLPGTPLLFSWTFAECAAVGRKLIAHNPLMQTIVGETAAQPVPRLVYI